MNAIVLTGFKGSGKTTVGRLLAARLGRRFVDLDDVLAQIHGEESGEGLSYREVFERHGAEEFRDLERRAAERLLEESRESAEETVVSVGGGAMVHDRTRDSLRRLGLVVCLRVPFAEILPRALSGGLPAYVTRRKADDELFALFRERMPVLARSADVILDAAGCSPDEAAERVARVVLEARQARDSTPGERTTR